MKTTSAKNFEAYARDLDERAKKCQRTYDLCAQTNLAWAKGFEDGWAAECDRAKALSPYRIFFWLLIGLVMGMGIAAAVNDWVFGG